LETQERAGKSVMKKQNLFCIVSLIALCASAQFEDPSSQRPVGAPPKNNGYATDQFEGFKALDPEEQLAQKEDSLWFSVSTESAAQQLAYCRKAFSDGNLRRARKGYEALIRKWPTTKEAAEAQLGLAQLYEARKNYSRAFEEYQYLLTFYSGACPYNDVLDRQLKIANLLRADNKSMFGFLLGESEENRLRYEQIVRNAPRSEMAPKCMLIVGDIRQEQKEMEEAIKVYDGLLNRFPKSPEAEAAAFFASQARVERAQSQKSNEANLRDARAFMQSVLQIMPGHSQRELLNRWVAELSEQLEEHSYMTAIFYDTKQRNTTAAIAAYRRFLSEFRSSKYEERVRERLRELEAAESKKGIQK
jgi:outer membrane protein assembly factor BamD (BamD/ComL family)